MVSRKLSVYGFISAAAIVSGILVGCGGSNSVQGEGGTITTTGGLPNTTATSSTTVPSSTQPQQVQVTSSTGTVITGTLPPGETITAGQPVSTIPSGVPIIQGLTLSAPPNYHGTVTTPTPSNSKAKPQVNGTPYHVYVDNQDSGVTVDSAGDLSNYIILVDGYHTLTCTGPFYIVGGSIFSPTVLTIQNYFSFGVPCTGGVPAIPTGINLKLPTNGGSWAHGPSVTVTYSSPPFTTNAANLTIVVDSSRTITEGRTLANGVASFYSLGASLINHNVPAGGVESVTFNVQ
jgi:hypothetical protein